MRAIKMKMRNIVILFFSLILTLAVFSEINAANFKPNRPQRLSIAMAGGATVVGSDWLYSKSNNDLSAYLGKKSSNLPTVRYQKGDNFLEFSLNNDGKAGNPSVSLETDIKEPNNPTLFYRNVFDENTDFAYKITNIPFTVKEEIALRNPPATPERSYGGRSSENQTYTFNASTTAKPVKQKDGSIAFFDKEGNYLFQLDKPFMIDASLNRSEAVSIEIVSTNKKPIVSNGFFDALAGASAGIVNRADSLADRNVLSSSLANIKKVLEARGIEPPRRGLTIPTLRQAAPRTGLVYHKPKPANYQIILTADSNWLSTATYPVVIDPTITHNADSNFSGQMNRIADSDTTTSTQLETSYGENVNDPYTVLNLHFNEANGSTNIKDYASTTRVITANGNASTTNYVTQLGMGNSAAFDGSGDYLSLANSSDWSLGTAGNGNYTIDFWTRWISLGATTFAMVENGPQTDGWELRYKNSTNVMQLLAHGAETSQVSWVPSAGVWYHVALIRSGSVVTLYIDGTSRGTFTDIDMTNNGYALTIGAANNGTQPHNGHLDEFRILKGRALTPEEIKATASRRPYAVYTSSVLDASASVAWNTLNWTEGGVNTGNGEQPYNTNSLVAQWDFNDTSGTTLTASSSGSCTTSCNGTLTNFAYTASQDQATTSTGWTANNKKWGAGALMFDGTNDYVDVGDNSVWDFGSNDHSLELWVKFNALDGGVFLRNYGGVNTGWSFSYDYTNTRFAYTNGATDDLVSWTPVAGVWYHIVLIKNSLAVKVYVNGLQIGADQAVFTIAASSASLKIGGDPGAGADSFGGFTLDSTRIYSRALSASEILSNYQAGNIEIQTRTGATTDPNDGTWEAWKPTTGETQLLSMDSDAVNWHSDIMASTTIATSTDTVLKMEGTGSLKVELGKASTTANTVALWHFEETGTTTGTYLYDETANNNDATTTGTTVADGIFGKARKFNGTSDYVEVSNEANFDLLGKFTLGAWIKLSYTSANNKFIISKYCDSSCSDLAYRFQVNGSNQLEVFVSDANGNNYILKNTTQTLIPNQWYYAVGTYDGGTTASAFKLYLNGLEITNTGTGGVGTYTGMANIAQPLRIGAAKSGASITYYFPGIIDEPFVSNRIFSPDEIAETYRMGANHHLTRQVSAVDLSAQTKLAFWIAADRPGTGLEAMLGESDHANYELASSTLALSTNTVLYIKGDEIANSTSIKDSSFSGKAITANGDARTSGSGKIGNSLYFDGTGDYLSVPQSSDFDFGNGDFSVDFWMRINAGSVVTQNIMGNWTYAGGSGPGWSIQTESFNTLLIFRYGNSIGGYSTKSWAWVPTLGIWYHIAIVRTGATIKAFVNGVAQANQTFDLTITTATQNFMVANEPWNDGVFNGHLDELRILKSTALTADQIRQAYEYGLRTHPITIDFGATFQPSDLISSATDYNFSITATTSGLSATTSGLYLGDKIIIKENLGGTEYKAQGTVNSINSTTGAITVSSVVGWDNGSTFPSGNGYSPNATVFKWQREYFDITGAATTTRNAITNLTLRPTNGAGGRTVYLDDFRYNTNYLTASSSSAITSGNGRYLQYRAIFSSWDSFVSPYLSAISAAYTALANSFPAMIGISGGGFLSF